MRLVACGAAIAIGLYVAWGHWVVNGWVERVATPDPAFYEVECARTCEAIRADAIAGTAFGCVCERAGTERFIIGRAWAP